MKIRTYEQQYTAQGAIEGRSATGNDFGGNIGAAMEELGDTGYKVADELAKLADAKDQVWRNNTVSTFQLQKFQELQAAKTDPDFAKKYGADGGQFTQNFEQSLDTDIANLVGTAPSNRSSQQLQMQLNGVKTSLVGHAIQFQAETGGAYMKDQLTQSMESDAKLASQSPGDTSMILDRGKTAIAGAPYLQPAQKTELLRTYEQNIAFAAGKGLVLHSPEKVLAAIAPDVLSTFKPTPRVLSNTSIPVTGFQPAAVAPAVEKYDSVVKQMAAQYTVDPNFMKAQLDQESKGNPAAVNNNDVNVTGSPSIGIAQFQPATAARYGIDPTKPEEAIKGQAAYMSDLLKMFGGDYRKAAAGYNWGEGHVKDAIATYGDKWFEHVPAGTRDYINQIFAKAQPVASAEVSLNAAQGVQATGEASRAEGNPDWFNQLDWKQQFQIISEAEQGVRANQVRDAQTLALQKQQREAVEQKTMDGMFDRIGAQNNPLTVAEVRHSDLTYQNKEHMLSAINSVTRGENATDPAVFNDTFARIHAPDGAPNKISDDRALLPLVGHGLSMTDLNVLRGELRGRNTPDGAATADLKKNFFTMAKGQIDTSTFISNDPIGKQKFYEFQQKVISTIDQETRAGTNALELFDPTSKKYLGKLIPMYQRTPTQQMEDYSKLLSGSQPAVSNVAPRQPGESAADYVKRTSTMQ